MAHTSEIGISTARMKYLGDGEANFSKNQDIRGDFIHTAVVEEGGNDAHTSIEIPEITNRWVPEADRSTSIGIFFLQANILQLYFSFFLEA